MVTACPYCGIVLDPPPTRSRKCPECGDKIVVRTDRETGEKLYLTSEAVARFDAARTVASARKKAIRRIDWMGLTEADYDSKALELAEKWGTPPSPGDVYWTLANEQVHRLGDPRQSGYEMQQIYSGMAQHLREEGRPHEHLQRQAHHARLAYERAKIEGFLQENDQMWPVQVLGNACCEACELLDGRTYTFEQALQEMPLPPEKCTRGWCNCSWGNVPPS